MPRRHLDILDAAERASDAVDRLIDRYPRRLLHMSRLRTSAQAIVTNIIEAFERSTRRDRDYRLRMARGAAEKAIGYLRANLRANRVTDRDYWPIHNLLVVVVKLLSSTLHH